jgi:hypothetical protein
LHRVGQQTARGWDLKSPVTPVFPLPLLPNQLYLPGIGLQDRALSRLRTQRNQSKILFIHAERLATKAMVDGTTPATWKERPAEQVIDLD